MIWVAEWVTHEMKAVVRKWLGNACASGANRAGMDCVRFIEATGAAKFVIVFACGGVCRA